MIFPNRYITLSSSLLGQVAMTITELQKQPEGVYCNNLSDRLGIKYKKMEYILVFLFVLDKVTIETLEYDIKVMLK